MSSIDAQIAEIKSRLDAARMAKARAEAVRENAEKAEAEALAELYASFGVDNVVDARATLVELQTDLQTLLTEITETLDKLNL